MIISVYSKGEDPNDLRKQMPAWIPTKTVPSRPPPPPSAAPLSAINQGAVSGILELRCYQRCPVYTHTTVSLISAQITDPPSNGERPEPDMLALCIALHLRLSWAAGPLLSDGEMGEGVGGGWKKKKQSICSGSCLKFNKLVSHIATVWCRWKLQRARAAADPNLRCYRPPRATRYTSASTNLDGHEIERKSEA